MFFGGGDDDDRANPIVVLALMILAPIAAMFIQMAITRSREYEADRTGAGSSATASRWHGRSRSSRPPRSRCRWTSPGASDAVHHQPADRAEGQFGNLFRTHPPTEDRIARLRSGDWQN